MPKSPSSPSSPTGLAAQNTQRPESVFDAKNSLGSGRWASERSPIRFGDPENQPSQELGEDAVTKEWQGGMSGMAGGIDKGLEALTSAPVQAPKMPKAPSAPANTPVTAKKPSKPSAPSMPSISAPTVDDPPKIPTKVPQLKTSQLLKESRHRLQPIYSSSRVLLGGAPREKVSFWGAAMKFGDDVIKGVGKGLKGGAGTASKAAKGGASTAARKVGKGATIKGVSKGQVGQAPYVGAAANAARRSATQTSKGWGQYLTQGAKKAGKAAWGGTKAVGRQGAKAFGAMPTWGKVGVVGGAGAVGTAAGYGHYQNVKRGDEAETRLAHQGYVQRQLPSSQRQKWERGQYARPQSQTGAQYARSRQRRR